MSPQRIRVLSREFTPTGGSLDECSPGLPNAKKGLLDKPANLTHPAPTAARNNRDKPADDEYENNLNEAQILHEMSATIGSSEHSSSVPVTKRDNINKKARPILLDSNKASNKV